MTRVTVTDAGPGPTLGIVIVHAVWDAQLVPAASPPTYAVTMPLLLKNPVPVTTTVWPADPDAGLIDAMCGPPGVPAVVGAAVVAGASVVGDDVGAGETAGVEPLPGLEGPAWERLVGAAVWLAALRRAERR